MTSGTGRKDILRLTKSRMLQPTQAYSRLYYNSKLKEIVDKEYKEHTDNTPKDQQEQRVAFTAKLLEKLLNEETDEVRAEVEAYRKKRILGAAITFDDNNSENSMKKEEEKERNKKMQE
jgi:hypothetical protein